MGEEALRVLLAEDDVGLQRGCFEEVQLGRVAAPDLELGIGLGVPLTGELLDGRRQRGIVDDQHAERDAGQRGARPFVFPAATGQADHGRHEHAQSNQTRKQESPRHRCFFGLRRDERSRLKGDHPPSAAPEPV